MISALTLAAVSVLTVPGGDRPAFGAWLEPCATAHLVAAWKHDGLWRTAAVVDPPRSLLGHQVRPVGRLHAGGRTYKIYYDDNSNPETQHGHQDLVVTTAKGKFLGLYDLGDITLEPVRIKGADILFDASRAYGDRIHFGTKGPPQKTRIDRSVIWFSRALEPRLRRQGRADLPVKLSSYCPRTRVSLGHSEGVTQNKMGK